MPNLHWLLVFSLAFVSWVMDAWANGHSSTLPLRKHKFSRSLQRRGMSYIGLGDNFDIIYSVEVQIGSDLYPLVFDTGSSDTLVLTDRCDVQHCGLKNEQVLLVPETALNFSALSVHFEFGGTSDSTEVNGEIASASVGIADSHVTQQFLGAINQTNLPFAQEGLSGLVGAGFPAPVGSPIELELLEALLPPGAKPTDLSNAFLSTINANAPLFTRLMLNGQFEQPMFAVTLERETFEIGGNIGQLTLGGLPNGVSNDSLTWVPVRLYTPQQGGIPGPSTSPNEIYPLRWEIPLDDVFINGHKLPRPSAVRSVGYSALIDSGTTGILGPQEIVDTIYNSISPTYRGDGTPPEIPCDVPVDITFVIGGKPFPLDPRDFFLEQSSLESCNAAALQPMDDPSPTALMSWVLGAAFIRSNLVAFYFGNFTHPSNDPPRIGFLSTVSSNASQSFNSDIIKASISGGLLPGTSITAPTGTFSATTTNFAGVAQQPTRISQPSEGPSGVGTSRGGNNGGKTLSVPSLLGTSIIIQVLLIWLN